MSEPIRLPLVQITGSGLCTGSDDGQRVFAAIVSTLKEGKSVQLSFEGVQDLTSAFLNAAIGQLYGKFSEEELKSKMSVADASPDDLVLLKRVVDRAKEFFKDPERFRVAAKQVLGDSGDE